jgi:hypothetical protein
MQGGLRPVPPAERASAFPDRVQRRTGTSPPWFAAAGMRPEVLCGGGETCLSRPRRFFGDLPLMSRPRALLAILLAATWCSAAWHVDLEAVGMLLEHEHHAHSKPDTGHAPPGGLHDEHEKVFARDVSKDQIGAGAVRCVALPGLASWLVAALRPDRVARSVPRRRWQTDPPFAHVWQFVRRCAPLSAAPPALR